MTTKITPTVGRVVLVFFAAGTPVDGYALPAAGTPLAGLITCVHNDSCINVAAFDANGENLPMTSVRLLQGDEKRPSIGFWAEWMPYQKQQAERHATEVARADEPKTSAPDTSDAAIEREIVAKGKTAPRVTPVDIEANIASVHYFTAQEGVFGAHPGFDPQPVIPPSLPLLTFCVLVLRNGFTVTGESACASPENFDAEIGRNIARQNAVQKIWPLMGYALKQELHDRAMFDAEPKTGGQTLPASHPVQQLADAIGGTIEHVERLPDGSGACLMSMPLPANHWLTQPGYNVPPMVFRKGTDDPERQEWAEKIRAAGRYAVRCATMNGAEDDFDPDALVQNLVVGMLGYFTPDGLSSDADANPPTVLPGGVIDQMGH